MRALRTLTGCIAVWCWPLSAQQPVSPLLGVRVSIDSLTQGDGYLVYSYRVINPQQSRGGIAVFSVDLSAPAGTGFVILPSTGKFWHGAGFPGVDRSKFREHVPVGPITPVDWKATLVKNGGLDWYGARGGGAEGQFDNIPPGDSLGGFGLRSPFLPGIRMSSADPTAASCCANLRPASKSAERQYPNAREFRVQGWTVGPTYPPNEVTLGVMSELLGRVCGSLGWINEGSICASLRSSLNDVVPARQRGDSEGAKQALRAFLLELEAQHGPGKPVSDNAYWLLKINGEYLLAQM